jgi:hypothetical protein
LDGEVKGNSCCIFGILNEKSRELDLSFLAANPNDCHYQHQQKHSHPNGPYPQ